MNLWHINRTVGVIRNEGVFACPTEAVYGIGCSAWSVGAIRRLLTLKRRKPDKGLIVVGADISQFRSLLDMDQLENEPEILASWPGPVTWIIPVRKGVSKWLTGDSNGLAVRITDHPQLRLLCLNAGILVSTSANPGGYEPARNPHRVRAYFGNKLDYILTGPTGQLAKPTEIRDAVSGRILRGAG